MTKDIIPRIQAWAERRAELSAQEASGNFPHADEWAGSDDEAVELLQEAAEVLKQVLSQPEPHYPVIDLGEAESLASGYVVEVAMRNGEDFDAVFLGNRYGTYHFQPVNDEAEHVGDEREIDESEIAQITVY